MVMVHVLISHLCRVQSIRIQIVPLLTILKSNCRVVAIIIIILIMIISYMQSIYTYIPVTNYVPREYGVAAILLLLFIF